MSGNGNIINALARVYVDDLGAALPLYERLTGETPYRFDYGPMSLAKVGDFLLVANATARVRTHTATIDVRDMALVVDAVTAAGGELLEGPAAGPNGARLVARHPDGTVVEYIETTLR